MHLIKGKRQAAFIPLDATVQKQQRRGKDGRIFVKVQFEPTKEERQLAQRLGRPAKWHTAWVNRNSLAETGGL
jgi:hypothetical protein